MSGSMEMMMQGTEAAMCNKTEARKAADPPKLKPKPNRRRQNEHNEDRKELRGPHIFGFFGSVLLQPPAPQQLHAKTTVIPSPPPYVQLTLPPAPQTPPYPQITPLPSSPHGQSTPQPSLQFLLSQPLERPTPPPSPPSPLHAWQTTLLSPVFEWPTPPPSPPHEWPTLPLSPAQEWPTPPSTPPLSPAYERSTPPPFTPQEWPTLPLSPAQEWPTPPSSPPPPSHAWQTTLLSPAYEWPPSSPSHEWPTPTSSPAHEWPTPPPTPLTPPPTPLPSPSPALPTPFPLPSLPPLPPKQTPPLPPKQTKLTFPPPLPEKQTKRTLPPPLPEKQTKQTVPPPLPPKRTQLTRKVKEPILRERENLLPKKWVPMPRDDKGHDVTVHMVKLARSSAEYQDVAKRFHETVLVEKIVSIERIQNPFLYQAYQLRKQKMDRDYGGNNELQLFHGTDAVNVTKINAQGFDRSFTGSAHGHWYGTGVYFARYASYSKCYTGGSRRVVYLARVLVGKYCKGRKNIRKPPAIDPEKPEILFDSMVDDMQIPSTFVVYYDNQCYPEYLITF